MRPKTIESIGCFVPLALVGVAAILWATKSVMSELAGCLAVAGIFGSFLLTLLLYLVPARCYRAECNGLMRRNWEISWMVGHIIYTCTACGAKYEGWVSWNTGDGPY